MIIVFTKDDFVSHERSLASLKDELKHIERWADVILIYENGVGRMIKNRSGCLEKKLPLKNFKRFAGE